MERLRDILAGGKHWFVWNRSAFYGIPERRMAELCQQSGATSVAVKAYDGTSWYNQHITFRSIAHRLRDYGIETVGAWGYHYGHDVRGELKLAIDCASYGTADYLILNVEDPAVELNPDTPVAWEKGLAWLREANPTMPIYFCSHAQPSYHPNQPYYQATQAGLIHMPMIYHTAMQMDAPSAVRVSRDDYDKYSLIDGPWSAAGGAYDTPGYPCTGPDLAAWADEAIRRGATSLIYWSLDSAQHRPDLLASIADSPLPHGAATDKGE